ncbi:MAG: hypothetical protein OEW12_06185 [Deltaproteobacteria bacterium]|nr:hypothetical protein [Deltaproteobacteria bacterium]
MFKVDNGHLPCGFTKAFLSIEAIEMIYPISPSPPGEGAGG